MADPTDRAQQDIDQYQAVLDKRFEDPKTVYEIPQGVEGDCDLCGEWFGRLVGGACVPCRTKYKLP